MMKLNLLKDLTNNERQIIKEKQNVDTFNKLFYVSIIFSVIGIIYIISDIVTGLYKKDFGYLDFAAVILLLVSSFSVAIMLKPLKNKIIRFIQPISAAYFLAISTVMLLFLSADLKVFKPDFFLCYFNFILISFVLNYNIALSITTQSMVVITTLGVVIGLSSDQARLMNSEQSIIILLGTVAAEHYLRDVFTKSFIKEYNIEQISKEFELSSTVDFLTKLSNRKGLDMFINKEISNAIIEKQSIAVSMLDIDDFKSYNDHYSHMTGDQCLKRIGAELNRLAIDKFHAFRYGGEEFLLIGINVTEAELLEFNNNLLASIRELRIDRSRVKSVKDYITVSIGSAIAKLNEPDDLKSLLKLADSRLYNSKRNGKNRITAN